MIGITSPYPRENIIAGNYILADTRAYLSKRHRQQNEKILIRHSPGIGECFFVFKFLFGLETKIWRIIFIFEICLKIVVKFFVNLTAIIRKSFRNQFLCNNTRNDQIFFFPYSCKLICNFCKLKIFF